MFMNLRSWIAGAISTACVLWATSIAAQIRGDPMSLPGQPGTPTTYGAKGLILLTVLGRNHSRLDRQALVKIFNQTSLNVHWQTTESQSEASIGDLSAGIYELEVSAVGYVPGHKEVAVANMATTYRVEVELAPDPDAVDWGVPATAQLPPKARKETNRALAALKSGNMKEAEKRLNSAYRLLPGSADVNFLMGYLFLEKGDLNQATRYLGSAASIDPRNVQALTLLGRVQLKQQDYTRARTTLERAVALNSGASTAHGLLAEAYLKEREYEKARLHAQLSVDKSKDADNTAQIVLGEALANLGRDEEAIQCLKTFLKYSPESPPSRQVQDLIAFLEDRTTTDRTRQVQPLPGIDPHLVTSESLDSDELRISIKTWQPPGIDDRRPSVAVGVRCPYEDVIHKAGFRVEELVDNVARFQAIEDLLHEDLDELGHTVAKDTRRFDYVVEISEQSSGEVAVKEYRSGHSGTADFPDQIATRGLPALALIFHPRMRDSFQMSCEGLGEWEGQSTWLVNFRQRQDKPNRIRAYKINSSLYPVNLKGRAWISAKTFELVHLESELTSPVREIQLLSEHAFVDYRPILFPKKQVELWLPKNAELYFDFRRHRYHRRHSFDHFMLFSVDSEERRIEPRAEPKPPAARSHSSPNP